MLYKLLTWLAKPLLDAIYADPASCNMSVVSRQNSVKSVIFCYTVYVLRVTQNSECIREAPGFTVARVSASVSSRTEPMSTPSMVGLTADLWSNGNRRRRKPSNFDNRRRHNEAFGSYYRSDDTNCTSGHVTRGAWSGIKIGSAIKHVNVAGKTLHLGLLRIAGYFLSRIYMYNCTKSGNLCINHHFRQNLFSSKCTHYLFTTAHSDFTTAH